MFYNTIMLLGDYRKMQSKALATGQTPKPGTLLSVGSGNTLTVHATRGAHCEVLMALEDALQGKTVDDAYVAGTVCDVAIPAPGSEFQALIKAGETVAVGALLCSAGDGSLEVVTSTYTAIAVAVEALDLSDSGSVAALCRVRRI